MFAQDTYQSSLPAALLLHAVRQDTLLYDFVQRILVPRWRSAEHTLVRADVQRFLDQAQPEHPEIDSWSHATREKLAGNMLSILRDYGLLRGRARTLERFGSVSSSILSLPTASQCGRTIDGFSLQYSALYHLGSGIDQRSN